MIGDLLIAFACQREDAQFLCMFAEGHVIRNLQPLLINFPFGRRLIDRAQPFS